MVFDFVQEKKRSGKVLAANLSTDELAIMNFIIDFRIKEGYSRDKADCLRQMMHFIVNKEYLQGYDFVLPANSEIENAINPINE